MSLQLEARNVQLEPLIQMLTEQRAHQVDLVVPSTKLSSRAGVIRVDSDEQIISESGVTLVGGEYAPRDVFIGGLAERLDVPAAYLRRLHRDRPDLFDSTVNGLLHGRSKRRGDGSLEVLYPADTRSHLFRGFSSDEPDVPGMARSLASPKYRRIDNLDVLTAAIDGMNASGIHTVVKSADLTERRMVVRFDAPEITAIAEKLTENYRSPFRRGHDRSPVVSAGVRFSNSETGDGRFTLAPEATLLVCMNGQTITRDMIAKPHLGAALEDGLVQWSAETQEANVALVRSQVKDAVKAWLNVDYLTMTIARLEQHSGVEIDNPSETVELIGKRFGYTQQQQTDILNYYISGGQPTAGGFLQAISAYSQTVADADAANDLETTAVAAMEFAASLAK